MTGFNECLDCFGSDSLLFHILPAHTGFGAAWNINLDDQAYPLHLTLRGPGFWTIDISICYEKTDTQYTYALCLHANDRDDSYMRTHSSYYWTYQRYLQIELVHAWKALHQSLPWCTVSTSGCQPTLLMICQIVVQVMNPCIKSNNNVNISSRMCLRPYIDLLVGIQISKLQSRLTNHSWRDKIAYYGSIKKQNCIYDVLFGIKEGNTILLWPSE